MKNLVLPWIKSNRSYNNFVQKHHLRIFLNLPIFCASKSFIVRSLLWFISFITRIRHYISKYKRLVDKSGQKFSVMSLRRNTTRNWFTVWRYGFPWHGGRTSCWVTSHGLIISCEFVSSIAFVSDNILEVKFTKAIILNWNGIWCRIINQIISFFNIRRQRTFYWAANWRIIWAPGVIDSTLQSHGRICIKFTTRFAGVPCQALKSHIVKGNTVSQIMVLLLTK